MVVQVGLAPTKVEILSLAAVLFALNPLDHRQENKRLVDEPLRVHSTPIYRRLPLLIQQFPIMNMVGNKGLTPSMNH